MLLLGAAGRPPLMAFVLIVDDEGDLASLIEFNLQQAGLETAIARTGEQALLLARQRVPDVVLLDLMLPDISGKEVCRRLRADPRTRAVPVVMLTARGEEIDRVEGFEVGADDYVTKPFSVRELMARIKAVLRRASSEQKDEEAEPSTLLRGPGNLLMDVERRSIVVGETSIELTRLEFDLLHRLLINLGRVLTRERLLEQAWGYEYVGDTRAVDSAVKRLRAKLREASAEADCIESVRGLGYRVN